VHLHVDSREKSCNCIVTALLQAGRPDQQRVSRAFAGRVGHAGTCMGVEEHDDSPGRRLGEKHDGRTRTCGQSRASKRTS
jgi:hypothetical protein